MKKLSIPQPLSYIEVLVMTYVSMDKRISKFMDLYLIPTCKSNHEKALIYNSVKKRYIAAHYNKNIHFPVLCLTICLWDIAL